MTKIREEYFSGFQANQEELSTQMSTPNFLSVSYPNSLHAYLSISII